MGTCWSHSKIIEPPLIDKRLQLKLCYFCSANFTTRSEESWCPKRRHKYEGHETSIKTYVSVGDTKDDVRCSYCDDSNRMFHTFCSSRPHVVVTCYLEPVFKTDVFKTTGPSFWSDGMYVHVGDCNMGYSSRSYMVIETGEDIQDLKVCSRCIRYDIETTSEFLDALAGQ